MNTYQFKSFSKHKNILHGISTIDFGSMKHEDGSVNRENLGKFLSFQKIPERGVCMGQIHGGDVVVVSDDKNLLIENTDGLITSQRNIPLCIMTADCLPILFFDQEKQAIGVAHAGRKGLSGGIIKNTIEKFKKEFRSDPKNIFVGIGPGIEEKCYEVDGKFTNIRKIANDQLLDLGISPENIENIDICTRCDEKEFYSFRRGDKNERFVSTISLV